MDAQLINWGGLAGLLALGVAILRVVVVSARDTSRSLRGQDKELAELKGDVAGLDAKVSGLAEGQAELRADMEAGQAELKADMKAGQAELKADMKAGQTELKTDMNAGYAGLVARVAGLEKGQAGLDAKVAGLEKGQERIDRNVLQVVRGLGEVRGELKRIAPREKVAAGGS